MTCSILTGLRDSVIFEKNSSLGKWIQLGRQLLYRSKVGRAMPEELLEAVALGASMQNLIDLLAQRAN